MNPAGLLIIDKPSGITSHGVVSVIRRTLHTRKVGHAGTLDPMATGVLILGVDRATRVLGYLALSDKEYIATIRLGESTVRKTELLWREQDGPRSQRRWPKGNRKPCRVYRLLRRWARITGRIPG